MLRFHVRFSWGRRPRVPSLIFAKNILLRERPGRRHRRFNIFLHMFPYFSICFHACFNGKIEIVMLRSLHIFQHRIFVGLMFGVLAGNLWEFEVRPNSQELDKLWSKIGELKPIALTSRKLRRDIAAIDFEAQTAIFDPIWSNGTPDFFFHHLP